ncbi:MAG TPA: tRNA (adenosine(37)-N6)-threonylcarbamoyltransferase complex ATPase subunit type 1 TsaE [Chthoniobacterales bacterium]|nr:tRNA (adenosine(37)-N6)-threonylcarbamoyltransferase complex ATPase subunit type 1 TsaE [Chthoniobacterales bacterium]
MKNCSGTGRVTSKPEETRSIAAEFARNLPAGTVLSLVGDLGAGKTEFVKGLAIGLGFGGDVTSPTFTILHEYRGGRLALFHMDFYRLQDERELDEIGLDEYLRAAGVCAIEWGDKFPQRLPIETVTVRIIAVDGDQREVVW